MAGTYQAWTVTSLAAHIRGELDQDTNAAGGTVPDRLKAIVGKAGAWLWDRYDWKFRSRGGTLSITSGTTTATLPNDFGELDMLWLATTADSADFRLKFTDDAEEFQIYAGQYKNDGTDNGEPRLALIVRDTAASTFAWKVAFAPQSDQAYSYTFYYLSNNPWLGSQSAVAADPLEDDEAPQWPPSFNEGWYLKASADAARAFGNKDQHSLYRSEFEKWLDGQVQENDETMADSRLRVRGDYDDAALTTSNLFRGGNYRGFSL